MSELMSLENSRLGEGFVALSTLERLCASVSELVCLEINTLVKGLIALFTLERPLCGNTIVGFFSSVSKHVYIQDTFLPK